MNISIPLNKDFEKYIDKMKEEYGEDFEELNSLSDKYLGFTTFIDNFKTSKTTADVSADGSSNVGTKDIVTLQSEMAKPIKKLLSYNKIFQEMKVDWGLRTAKKWFELEWNKSLYLHDASSATFVHYCFAYDLKRVAEEGLFYLADHNEPEPAQHLETFVDFVKEFISFTSNRSSGAVGLPNLIPYMYYFWNKDCNKGVHGLKVVDGERFAKGEIQRIIYGMNQPYTRDGIQSAFINTSIFDDDYFVALFGGATFPDGEFMIDHQDGIMQFQRWFLEEMKAIKDHGRMFTFPVNTISLLVKDDDFANPEFAHWCSNHNRYWNDSNIFTDTEVTSLSNCCRLKSNVKDLGYFNSIGGSALKVGSIKVNTVNLARIAYECKGNRKKYLDILEDRVVVSLKMLHTLRGILRSNAEDKKLLNNFQDGIVDFEHLYNTIGINGIYETMKTFGYTTEDEFGNILYTDDAMEFGEQIFNRLHETLKTFTEDKDYMANIEQVPAETAAVKFFEADQLLYPTDVVKDLPLYGNQWIPLGIKTTMQERIRICAAFDKFCNGGSIMHLNIDAPFDTDEKAWDMLNYITKNGVTYFAFNGKLSTDDNGHLFYGETCPECGAPKTADWTRTVGFYTKTATWSKERKAEFKLREWHPLNVDGINS